MIRPPSPFLILCQGRWASEQIVAHYQPTPHLLPYPHNELAISHWQRLLTQGDQHLFNGQLFRLESYEASTERLQLAFGHTCYRDQIYCNANTTALVQTYGKNALTQGLGVSAVVITRDGYLPLMRRGQRVGEEPGKLDVFGGHAHPDQHLRAGIPDLFRAIVEEIIAEMNVASDDIVETICCGLIENLLTHKPDLVFEIKLNKSREEIIHDAVNAAEAEEVAELFFIAHQVAALEYFLAHQSAELTPTSHGSLTLFAATLGRQLSSE